MTRFELKDYQEDRKDRGVYDKRNPLNDLTGKEWLFSTKTVIPKSYPDILGENIITRNLSPIPVQLCTELVETFSKPKETVLDPFFGAGSFLIGALFANAYIPPPRRNIIGLELQEEFFVQFTKIMSDLHLKPESSISLLKFSEHSSIPPESIDLVITDFPVWNPTNKNSQNSFCLNYTDIMTDPEKKILNWLNMVVHLLKEIFVKLKMEKYLILSLPGNFEFLSSESSQFTRTSSINFFLTGLITNILSVYGLTLKSERIWFQPAPNSIHTELIPIERRILVFRKELKGSSTSFLIDSAVISPLLVGSSLIIHKSYPPSYNHALRRQHGGMKPPELTQLLIEIYCPEEGIKILDPFAGVGGTLIGAALANKDAVGIDINKEWKMIYENVSKEFDLPVYPFFVGDSRNLIPEKIPDSSIDLILTDVPYWAMDKLEKTRGKFSRAGEPSRDKLHSSLSKFNETEIPTLEVWLELLKEVFMACYAKLTPQKYLIVFIGNMYRTMTIPDKKMSPKKGQYLLLTTSLARTLVEIGYQFQHELIWYAPDKALHIFGYPFSYIPSVVHQSILVFRK